MDTRYSDDKSQADKKRLGMSGLMRAFAGKTTFKGNWDEDLANTIDVFNTLAGMCEVNEQ